MANIIEEARKVFGLKQPVVPPPPDIKPTSTETSVTPVMGIGRDRLLTKCKLILLEDQITPDMFNELTSHMFDLIGGTRVENQEADNYSIYKMSGYVNEPETSTAISVKRHSWISSKLESGSIIIQPDWIVPYADEGFKRWRSCTDLVIEEELHYGFGGMYDREQNPVPYIEIDLHFPPNYEPPSVKLEMLEKPIPLIQKDFDPRLSRIVIDNERLKAICNRTLAAVEHQK